MSFFTNTLKGLAGLCMSIILGSLIMVLASPPLHAQNNGRRLVKSATPASAPKVASAPGPRVMLITDGSGSMWGRLGNRSKVYLARDAMKKVLPQFHNRLSLGLMAFGSRVKRSCSDVSTVVPLVPLDASRFIKAFNAVNPLGRTPVTMAIRQAANALDYKRKKSTIIVLIDGFENCKGDPCALARQLKRDGKDLTIHVVGVGMKARDQRSISCITNATKGQFINTASENSLRRAMTSLLARSASPTEEKLAGTPHQKPKVEKPKGPPELMLTAMLANKGPRIAAGLNWRVRQVSKENGTDRDFYVGEAPQPRLKLEPGSYIVEARLGGIKIIENVTVGKAGLTRAVLNFDAGRIKIRAFADRGAKALNNVFYSIYRNDGKPESGDKSGNGDKVVAITAKPEPEYTLPAGNYTILVQHGGTRSERVINVVAGKVADVDIVMYSGELVLQAVHPANGKTIEGVYYFIYEDAPLAPGGRREIARSAAVKPDFRLPAGTYHVLVKWGNARKEMRGTVRAGKRKTLMIPMQSGTLSLNASVSGQVQTKDDPVTFSVYQAPANGGLGKLIAKTSRPSPVFHLDAGSYSVVASFGDANASTRSLVQISSGQQRSIQLDIPAAIMDLKLKSEGTGGYNRDVFWTISSADGKAIWTTGNSAPRTPVSPGSYMVVATYRGKTYRKTLDIKSGELKSVILSTN